MSATTGTVLPAWRSVRLIAAAKWRTVRRPSARAWLWVGAVVGALGLSVAAQAGDLIRLVAEIEGTDSVPGVVANTYVRQWVLTGFGTITSAILGFVVGSAVLAPMVSSSAPTLMPEHELAGVRTASMHPYLSALAVHLTSLVTFVQLLALTALAGLLTIDGVARARAVLLSWVVWLVLVVLAQATLWASRLLRRPGPWAVTAVLAAAGAVAVLEPQGAAGLFGGSAAFTWWLLVAPGWVSVLGALAVAAVAVRVGWAWCAAAVRRNAVATPAAGTDRVTRAMPADPARALVAAVVRSFVRTRSIRSPLITITALAAVGVAMAGDQPAGIWSVGIGVPVAVGLAWTDNAAAMTGPANSWLASLPGQGVRLLAVWAGWGWLVSVGLVLAAWAPAALAGRVSVASTGSVVLTGVAAASTVTAAALWHAVRRPVPARTDLGDGMLSATRAAGASMRLLAGPGMAAWLVTSGSAAWRADAVPAPLAVQAGGAALSVLAALGVGAAVRYRWSNPRTRALCLAGAA